jgi:hypothetical protein
MISRVGAFSSRQGQPEISQLQGGWKPSPPNLAYFARLGQ